jgi:hypothetical protein
MDVKTGAGLTLAWRNDYLNELVWQNGFIMVGRHE